MAVGKQHDGRFKARRWAAAGMAAAWIVVAVLVSATKGPLPSCATFLLFAIIAACLCGFISASIVSTKAETLFTIACSCVIAGIFFNHLALGNDINAVDSWFIAATGACLGTLVGALILSFTRRRTFAINN